MNLLMSSERSKRASDAASRSSNGLSWDDYKAKNGRRNYDENEEEDVIQPRVPESCCNPEMDQVDVKMVLTREDTYIFQATTIEEQQLYYVCMSSLLRN